MAVQRHVIQGHGQERLWKEGLFLSYLVIFEMMDRGVLDSIVICQE